MVLWYSRIDTWSGTASLRTVSDDSNYQASQQFSGQVVIERFQKVAGYKYCDPDENGNPTIDVNDTTGVQW